MKATRKCLTLTTTRCTFRSSALILILFKGTDALLLNLFGAQKLSRSDFGILIPLAFVSNIWVLPEPSSAVVMQQPAEKVFEVGAPMNVDDAKSRFQEARKTLTYLVENYDVISKGGGDDVRRYLGTVGTSSALYGISRVMKELQDDAEDVIEYTESMQDFDYFLRAADTAAYSANFVEYSAAKTKPEKFLEDARSDCTKMTLYMEKMAVELKLN
jgi:hypothetical protein